MGPDSKWLVSVFPSTVAESGDGVEELWLITAEESRLVLKCRDVWIFRYLFLGEYQSTGIHFGRKSNGLNIYPETNKKPQFMYLLHNKKDIYQLCVLWFSIKLNEPLIMNTKYKATVSSPLNTVRQPTWLCPNRYHSPPISWLSWQSDRLYFISLNNQSAKLMLGVTAFNPQLYLPHTKKTKKKKRNWKKVECINHKLAFV